MTQFNTPDERWRALCERLPDADGAFVYSVKTTGIFCRPSCPSRAPRRENVAFYATAAEAQAAGFRACLRCAPLDPADPRLARMEELARYIQENADEPLPLAHLARRAGLSPAHLQRSFTAALGVSPKQWQQAARLGRCKQLLRGGAEVLHATFEAGYGSTSRLYQAAETGLGMRPRDYRAGGAHERIWYAAQDTAHGLLLLAATERGVCFVQFGESEAALVEALRREFPAAALAPSTAAGSPALADWTRALSSYLAREAPQPALPLDLRGTAFQLRVWRFLTQLRDGEQRSYTELAAALGSPRAVRAVASACASNRVAILVPCHRILRGDGSLAGYRWGIERKRALLAAEQAAPPTAPQR